MKVEIHKKELNATTFEQLEFGAIFCYGGLIMIKIYESEYGESCGLIVDHEKASYMETYDIDNTAPIYEIYENSKLIIQ